MTTNKKISTLIESHLPEHIVSAYPNFVEFIEAYYEWMEGNKQAVSVLKNLLNNQDIDTTSFGSAVLTLSSGSGTYNIGEIVYQGSSVSNALAKGRVFDTQDGNLEVINTIGQFNTGFGPIVGLESGASYLIENIDFIASSLNDFIRWFRVEFIPSIPKDIITDPKKLIKHSRQFYKAKGTQKSYRLLFRILYNTEIDFYYPWTDLFRPDDAKWIEPTTIKVRALTGNSFQFIGRRIQGEDSLASAIVEDVISYNIGFITIHEVFLNRLSLSGNFLPNENIVLDDENIDVIARISATVQGVNITDAGEGYSVGDLITFNSFTTGSDAEFVVTQVGSNGEIEKIRMLNFGGEYDFANVPSVVFPFTLSPAFGTAQLGVLNTYPGFFLNDDGMTDTTKYLRDDHFYQQFSYVIKVNQSIDQYRDIVKKLLHPAGLIFFNELLNLIDLDLTSTFADVQPCAFVDIVRQQFFDPKEFPSLSDYTFEDQLYPLYNSLGIEDCAFIDIVTTFDTDDLYSGHSNENFDYLKHTHLPFAESELVIDDPLNYWINNIANYQYENIGHLTYKQFEDNPKSPIDIIHEPRVEIETTSPMILIFDTNL